MNSLLQKHGCANVFAIPEGLKELMSDITREVLRDQPTNILEYISGYLWALLVTREHGTLAVKILEELCDCRPTLEERLGAVGISLESVHECAKIIQRRFEDFEPIDGEKLKEKDIVKKLLGVVELDIEQAANVCHIIQEVYLDYYQRKKSLQKTIADTADEPWKVAAQRTIDIYKTTRPTFDELVRATEKIQAAYRGYHVRRQMIHHLEAKFAAPEGSTTTALDIAGSREIDLGPKMTDLMAADEVASPNASLHEKASETSRSVTLRFGSETSAVDKDTRGRAASVQFSVAEAPRDGGGGASSQSRASNEALQFGEEQSHAESAGRDDFDRGSRSEADGASETATSMTSEVLSEEISSVGEYTENEGTVETDEGELAEEVADEAVVVEAEAVAGDAAGEEVPEELKEQDSSVEEDEKATDSAAVEDEVTTDGEEAD